MLFISTPCFKVGDCFVIGNQPYKVNKDKTPEKISLHTYYEECHINQRDNHEARIKALETGDTQALTGRIASLEEEVAKLMNVLAESGFINTSWINEND